MAPNFLSDKGASNPCMYASVERASNSGLPGVDVMIINFCDFGQFSSKKLAFFSKSNVMNKILHNLALF
jgi:hypothetical protein